MGMMVDVSHISDKTVLDAVNASKAPVLASHSSAKSIAPIVRNMPDEVITAIAKKGGVVCINFHAGYLDKEAYEVYIKNRPDRDREIKEILTQRPTDPARWEQVRGIQKKYFDRCRKLIIGCSEAHRSRGKTGGARSRGSWIRLRWNFRYDAHRYGGCIQIPRPGSRFD